MKRINRLFLFAAFMILGATSAHAAEMYYNRLSTGDKIIPAGTYGTIIVPEGGYKATQFPSGLDTISQAAGDYGGSYAGIIGKFGSNCDLADHTISGWFKVATKASETTLLVEKTLAASKYTSHRGNAIKVSADGHLVVGKINSSDTWQDTGSHITSTDTVPLDQWFYLTVNFTVNHGSTQATRTATAKAYVNGVAITLPTTSFQCNYNSSDNTCAAIKVGDSVECAGLRVDDAVIDDTATMKAWATDERYLVRITELTHAMPYISMGYRITDDTTGTFLTYDSQLAFPGYTLDDVLTYNFFGRLTGKNIATYDKGYEGGLQIERHIQAWTNDQSQLEKVLFTVNGRKTSTYAKVVTVLLTNGVDGVYAVVPASGACNSSSAAEGDKFAEFNTDGSVKYLYTSGKDLATSDTASGYGCRGLTMTRYIPSDKPVLAFAGTTVDAIKYHTFTGYSTGRSMSNGYTSIPMASYNEKVTEESEGVATKLRAEMQVIDGSNLKCVVVEFTDGTDGVYVQALTAQYVGKAEGLGYKFVNMDGSYNGTNRTYARDFSIDGYGVFALKAYAPPAWAAAATWTNAAGNADPTVAENWVCYDAWGRSAALPDATMTVKIGGETALNTTSEKSFVCKAIELTDNVTLTGDSDWSYLPDTPIATNSKTIDVNGHNLTLNRVFAGTVTDGTSGEKGALTLTVAQDETLTNTGLAMTGNLKLIKSGAGTLVMGKNADITEAEIAGGLFKLSSCRGLSGSGTVTVGSGATLDENGCYDTAYGLVLQNGATLMNSGTGRDYAKVQFGGGITLAANATVYVDNAHEMSFTAKSYAAYPLNLNGGTLVKRGTAVLDFTDVQVANGTVRIEAGNLYLNAGNKGFSASADTIFEATGTGVLNPRYASTIPTLKGDGAVSGTAALTVSKLLGGEITVNSAVTLANGGTLDLSKLKDVYAKSTKLTFGAGTITVDIYDRELAKGDQVVAWSEKPDGVTFQWDDATLAKTHEDLTTTSSGIYYGVSIATAYWTNALGDGDLGKAGNWACTNTTGQAVADVLPTAESTVYFTGNNINVQITDAPIWAAVNVNGKLGGNCDWTGLAETSITEGSTIDVNGHNLTLNRVFAGTITDTTTDITKPGSLTMAVAEDTTIENTTLSIQGNLKFIKEGEGTFVSRLKNQNYAGGTEVNAGTIKSIGYELYFYYGADGTPFTINAGGILDINGQYSWYRHHIYMNGGEIRNSGSGQTGYDNKGLGDVTLTADSTVNIAAHTLFHNAGAKLDLGGYTLTVTGSDKYFSFSNSTDAYTITNGTLVISTGAQLNTRVAAVNLTDTRLVIEANGKWLHSNADFTVKSLTMENNTGSARIVYVTGAFKSVTGNYKYICLKNGATIDLTENAGVLDTAGKNFTFEANATITVDIHGRALAKGTQLVAWTAIPANVTFQWDAATLASEPETLTTTDDGLFYGISDVADAYWTNAAGDGDVDNWQNWACTNSSGAAVAKGLPISSSVIHLPQYIRFQVPTGKAIACSKIQLKANAMLSEDCDWRGLGVVTVVPSGTSPLFLGGHTLRTAGLATEDSAELQVVNAHDALSQLVFDIPSGQTYENDHLAILQNIQVVKEGAGTFVANKASQTYTGGTVVAAGTVKPGIQGTNGPFGAGTVANKKLITVESGATFDLNGQVSHTVYRFILNGGTLTNTAIDMGKTTGFGSLTLGADSTLAATRSTSGWCGHTIDLGGYTLTATIGSGKRLYLSGDYSDEPVTYKAGKVVVSSGGWLNFYKGKVNAKSVDFDINAALAVEVETDVHDYTSRYAQNYNNGTAALNVYGTFKPVSSYWYGCTMQGGSTIDLTERSGTWSLTSSFTGGSKTVQFADGALVWVDLTGRTDLKKGDKIIAWTTKPNAKLKVIPETMGVVMRDDGLYLGIEEGVPVVDASGKGSITIPTEWVTAHAMGETPEEQYASLTAPRETGNKITLRDNYVLGLNPDEATSIPVIHPIQSSNPDVVVLNVGGLDVHPESGAIVKYQLMEKTSSDGEYVAGSAQASDTFVASLPESGVKYYQVNVIVTTPEAGEEETVAQVMINGKAYTSFAEAVADAESGDTLVMMDDVDNIGTVSVNEDITLDMNELTVSGTINVKSGAKLTVVGVGEFDGPIHVEDGGTLDWKNGTHKE